MIARPHPERLLEAVIFASRDPVPLRALATLLPEGADLDTTLAAIRTHHSGGGIELVEIGQGVMFRTAPDLAPDLKRVVEVPRRLPRAAMETLAIVAYHQPCTRADIEDIRGVSLSQTTLDALLEANLIVPAGHKETPGRPSLWATTPHFLVQFGLKTLGDLPKRADLLVEPIAPATESQAAPEPPAL
ncbi:MAG: SMC-Scp complex subunit ScpB [Acidiphilium sp.]|nr:SMC-Scp complex subunit ScpB [Acidiphilium sp.]MDD4935814.1 SMC-Scp complex subunit ScpB [Acidiphilium sp.]